LIMCALERPAWRICGARWLAAIAAVTLLVASHPVNAQSVENVRGTVRSLTTAPKGEIDGATLDNGTVLHWPPHLEDSFKAIATVGDRVEAIGQTETAPRGEVHFEVQRLTNLRSNAVAVNDDRGPPPPKGRGPRGRLQPDAREATTTRGVVRSMTTAPKGEIDGALLDDGTALHWPPHLEANFKSIVTVGDRVEAVGRTETAPRGEINFEVQRVTNLRTNATAVNDDQAPAAGPRGRFVDREEQIRRLQDQLLQVQRELDRLRREP
jgi:hypothetical protein